MTANTEVTKNRMMSAEGEGEEEEAQEQGAPKAHAAPGRDLRLTSRLGKSGRDSPFQCEEESATRRARRGEGDEERATREGDEERATRRGRQREARRAGQRIEAARGGERGGREDSDSGGEAPDAPARGRVGERERERESVCVCV